MNKELLKEKYGKAIEANYEVLSPFLGRSLTIFEVESVKQEIVNCLIINLYQASITLTNHLLERGLKLALIHNEVGIVPFQPEEWETKFINPNQRYGSLFLHNAIEVCAKELLITGSEKQFLINIIKEEFRNGFSHADMSKILTELPPTGTYFVGKFSEVGVVKKVEIAQTKVIPLQSILQESFAEQNALLYFKYVYNLLINIEKRLTDKFNKCSI